VLVADDSDDTAIPEDWGVEHRTDSERDKVGIAKLVGRRVHGGIVRGNVAPFLERTDVGRKVAGMKDGARRVPVLRELVELTAPKNGAVRGKGPHSHSFDLDCAGRDLRDAPQDLSERLHPSHRRPRKGKARRLENCAAGVCLGGGSIGRHSQ